MIKASPSRLLIFPRLSFSHVINRPIIFFFSVVLNGYCSVKDVIIEQKQLWKKKTKQNKMNFHLDKLWFFGSFLKAFQVLHYISNSGKKQDLISFLLCGADNASIHCNYQHVPKLVAINSCHFIRQNGRIVLY